MNSDLPSASICYGLYDEDKIIGFCGVLHQPHGINKKIKRVTRLVILPDYQGIGLGTKFLNVIAELYTKQGFDFNIVTTAKNLAFSLIKNKKWNCIRYGVNNCSSKKSEIDYNRTSLRNKCKTFSFSYKH